MIGGIAAMMALNGPTPRVTGYDLAKGEDFSTVAVAEPGQVVFALRLPKGVEVESHGRGISIRYPDGCLVHYWLKFAWERQPGVLEAHLSPDAALRIARSFA